MRLQIRPGDEVGFERARGWVLDGLGRWLRDECGLGAKAIDDVVWGAEVALDWKFGYEDGHLGRWTTGDVTDFLRQWCPRKLSISAQDSVTIPGSVAALTDYLAARGLLERGSSSSAALRAAATNAVADFIAEMEDPANFGIAKSLFTEAGAHGYDLADETSADAWMSEFNALSYDERAAILPGEPELPSVPPVVLPPAAVIAESRASAPVLAMFGKLAEYAGTGRKLTQTGNLSLADARELVRLLGTGDVTDGHIGDKAYPVRNSADLPVLRLLFAWARKAGVIRVRHGKVLATKRGLALPADPAAMFDRAVDALFALGPVSATRHPKAWPSWPGADRAVDDIVRFLLIRPYTQRLPVSLAELTQWAMPLVRNMYAFAQWPEEAAAAHVGEMLSSAMEALELAGIVRRSIEPDSGPEAVAGQHAGAVELTPAGLAAVRRLLEEAGLDAPVAGRWADATAEEVLTGPDRSDPASLLAEIDAWRQRRTPEQAVAELAAAVRQITDPGAQNIALAVMSEIGIELAAPHVREMAGEQPSIRGFARCWLADRDMLDAKELYDPADLESFAYVLTQRLIVEGEEGLLACLALVGGEKAQAQVVGDLGKTAGPTTATLLEAINQLHPAKSVAKAARKAQFVLRSRAANGL